jgi:alpha-D-ribose 1-methylphosphonate 5-triphosphate synthase subunit PhnG
MAWMRLLAVSQWGDLEACAAAMADIPHDVLRAPETGLVMLRGRIGATGAAFNFGEATVTRCAVKLPGGAEGHAYIMGRNSHHARLAAICDALLQTPETHATVHDTVLVPLEEKLVKNHRNAAGKAAATKVDFFTMVRGDV